MGRGLFDNAVPAGAGLAILLVMAAACAGGGGQQLIAGQAVSEYSRPAKATGVLINESEIASLPGWQQEKLCDPGWNEPYIAPPAVTDVQAPSAAMLEEYMARRRAEGIEIRPRAFKGKSASWMDQGGFDGVTGVLKGEYDGIGKLETPPYGCNNIENSYRDNGLEDVIREGTKYAYQAISYVLEGRSESNWFNRTGGQGNDAQSAVYQLFASSREAVAGDWDQSNLEFEELSYRADLAPGIGNGGDCSAAEAFLVSNIFWKRFNSATDCLPNGEEVMVYDILIAPSSEESALMTSSGCTDGRYQEFYCGDLGACYGGGWIVGVEASGSGCRAFDEKIVEAYDAGSPWYYSPIFGVLLKRWQDAELAGMAGPWESWLGWPVAGPMAFDGGRQLLSPKGTYHQWGMWFERGFIWWLDYDQELYPETPDEAHAYKFEGSNVFCPSSGGYSLIGEPIFYGGNAAWPAPNHAPRVKVIVDSHRPDALSDWWPCEFSDRGEVLITLRNDGLATVNVAMHAHAWGGTPNDDGGYDYYVWAFRDGTIFMGDETSAQHVTHTYGSDIRNLAGNYTVRVQVTDSSGAVGYGDSRPIILGIFGGGSTYR